jgi:hypothetical protein
MTKNTPAYRLFEKEPGPNNTVLNWHGAPEKEFCFYAASFHKAAKTLVESWQLDANSLTDFDACPIVFLYRHAAELYLKGLLLGPGANFLHSQPDVDEICKDHFLTRLLPMVREMFKGAGWDGELNFEGVRTLDDLDAILKELDDIDPGSFTFRYPIKRKGLDGSVAHHFTFSAQQFAKTMDGVCEIFECARIGLPEEWNARAEAAAYESDDFGDDPRE